MGRLCVSLCVYVVSCPEEVVSQGSSPRRGIAEGKCLAPLTLEQEEAQDGAAQLHSSNVAHVSWGCSGQTATPGRLCP